MIDIDTFDNVVSNNNFTLFDSNGAKVTEGSMVLLFARNDKNAIIRVKKIYKKDSKFYLLSTCNTMHEIYSGSNNFIKIDDAFLSKMKEMFNSEDLKKPQIDFNDTIAYYVPLAFVYSYNKQSHMPRTRKGIAQFRVNIPRKAVTSYLEKVIERIKKSASSIDSNFNYVDIDVEELKEKIFKKSFMVNGTFSTLEYLLKFEIQKQIINILREKIEDFNDITKLELFPLTSYSFEQRSSCIGIKSNDISKEVEENNVFNCDDFCYIYVLNEEDKIFDQDASQPAVFFFTTSRDDKKADLINKFCSKGTLSKNKAQKTIFFGFNRGLDSKFSFSNTDSSADGARLYLVDPQSKANEVSKKLFEFLKIASSCSNANLDSSRIISPGFYFQNFRKYCEESEAELSFNKIDILLKKFFKKFFE